MAWNNVKHYLPVIQPPVTQLFMIEWTVKEISLIFIQFWILTSLVLTEMQETLSAECGWCWHSKSEPITKYQRKHRWTEFRSQCCILPHMYLLFAFEALHALVPDSGPHLDCNIPQRGYCRYLWWIGMQGHVCCASRMGVWSFSLWGYRISGFCIPDFSLPSYRIHMGKPERWQRVF